MKITEQQKKILIVAVFVLFAGGYVYWMLFRDPTPPPVAAAPVITTSGTIKVANPRAAVSAPPGMGGAQKVATTSGQLDPTLHMEAMLRTESLVYSGTGRNIFAAGPDDERPPVKIDQVKFSGRPGPVAPRGPISAPVPAGPPPIDLKFFGTVASGNGTRRAFLLNGDNVWLASVGDVVERRYRIVSISPASILVEDIPNTNKQTLPLVAK